MVGLHSFAIDNVVSFDVVTAEGNTLQLSEKSEGDELALFHALCGAGYGFGVVTSLEINIFPLAALRLPDNKYWTRSLIFKGNDVDVVADAFAKLQPRAALATTLMFARSPPGSPAAGAPMVMLLISYFGPPDEAEKEAAFSFDENLVKKAIKAVTSATSYDHALDAFDIGNKHGGHKHIASAWVKSISPEAIQAAYQMWVVLTEDAQLGRSIAYIGVNDTTKAKQLGTSTKGKRFFENRDRSYCAFTLTIHDSIEKAKAARAFADECKAIYRQGQPTSDPPRTFSNNLLSGTDPAELYTQVKLDELARLKSVWDNTSLFWSPWVV